MNFPDFSWLHMPNKCIGIGILAKRKKMNFSHEIRHDFKDTD